MNTIVGTTFLGIGLLLILLCLPLLWDKVPMNDFYGVRIPRAFESDEMWYRLNRYGARQLIRASVLLMILGAAALLVPFEIGDAAAAVMLLLLPVVILAAAFITFRHGEGMTKTR